MLHRKMYKDYNPSNGIKPKFRLMYGVQVGVSFCYFSLFFCNFFFFYIVHNSVRTSDKQHKRRQHNLTLCQAAMCLAHLLIQCVKMATKKLGLESNIVNQKHI